MLLCHSSSTVLPEISLCNKGKSQQQGTWIVSCSPDHPLDLAEVFLERNLMSLSVQEGVDNCQINHRSHNKPEKEESPQNKKNN